MGKGYKHGGSGGAALNFTVKTYPSEVELKADNPKENTIGVITSTTMTSWVISATEPKEPEVGMIWISVGGSSSVEFNALKHNTLQVYPICAKQYEVGAWVVKVAFSYQNNEWVNWWNGELFDNGNQFENITGGWTASGYSHSSYAVEEASIIDGNIYLVGASNKMVMRGTDDIVDLSKHTKLHWSGNVISIFTAAGEKSSANLFIVSQKANFVQHILAQYELNVDAGPFSVDISISGIDAGYILVRAGMSASCVSNTQKIWME